MTPARIRHRRTSLRAESARRHRKSILEYAAHRLPGERKRIPKRIRAAQPDFDAEKWGKIIPDKRAEDVELFVSGLRLAGL